MDSLIYLILKILFFTSLLPLFFLILKLLTFGLKKFKKNLTYNLFILITPIILVSFLIYTKSNKKKESEKIVQKKETTNKKEEKDTKIKKSNFDLLNPNYNFTKGIIIENNLRKEDIDLKKCIEGIIKKNENITSILKPFNITTKKFLN